MTSNLSEHTGLTLAGLLAEPPSLESELAEADVILVGIAHNSIALNSDMPCGGDIRRVDEPTVGLVKGQCPMCQDRRRNIPTTIRPAFLSPR
jgi:hypothetical protein